MKFQSFKKGNLPRLFHTASSALPQVLFVGQRPALRLAVVDDRQYELSEGGGDHEVHPSKMARYAGTLFPVRLLEGFELLDAW